MSKQNLFRDVYIVNAKRTPQVKSGFDLKDIAAPYLGAYLVRYLMDQTSIENDGIDEVIFGNAGNPPKYPNVGRVIALEARLHKKTSGLTVHRNCASGLEALSQGFLKVASGRAEIVIVGGVENMSQMPLIYSKKMTECFFNILKAKSLLAKMKAILQFRPAFLIPVIAVEQGLTDPFCGLNMGETAEKLAREFDISREEQDTFANNSHHKAVKAQQDGDFDEEILPLIAGRARDQIVTKDIGPRANSTMESLAKLRPYFEKKSGTVTVGNSCPLTDGGSAMMLAGEDACEKYGLDPLGRFVDFHFHGLEPERMGLGPLVATHGLLQKTKMSLQDMGLVEINEAFAAQVLALKKAFADEKIAKQWGVNEKLGTLDDEKLNVSGGAIALGHPVGSTGARLVVTLLHALKRKKLRYGLASLCIGGGQGGACLIENLKREDSV